MPIQFDHSKPVRTVDTTGRAVSTDTKNAAPIKTVDTVGRPLNVAQNAKEEAKQVAETAAKAMPAFAAEAGSKDPQPTPPPETLEHGDSKTSEAQVRKEYLEAQRLRRQAEQDAKRAKASLEKAEAFEKARALAESGEDPTALLRAADLDPVKFYQKLTAYSLSDKNKEEADPVKRELNDHKKQLEDYKARLDAQAKAIEEKEATAAHNQVIQDRVIPLLANNTERYEALLMHYGNQAAVEVYQTVWDIYQKTGVARKFEEVADEMENYWSSQIETGLTNALRLKKFANRFTQSTANELPRDTKPEPQDTSNSSKTLSNKQQIATTPSKEKPYKGLTKEERVAAIIKQFGG